jgi:hypothetical protein
MIAPDYRGPVKVADDIDQKPFGQTPLERAARRPGATGTVAGADPIRPCVLVEHDGSTALYGREELTPVGPQWQRISDAWHELTLGDLVIRVTGRGGRLWLASCERLCLSAICLGATDADGAKREAVEKVATVIDGWHGAVKAHRENGDA